MFDNFLYCLLQCGPKRLGREAEAPAGPSAQWGREGQRLVWSHGEGLLGQDLSPGLRSSSSGPAPGSQLLWLRGQGRVWRAGCGGVAEAHSGHPQVAL